MLLEFLARYYKFFWLGLGAICFIKIILASMFHGSLQGVNGMIYALFKWYDEDEQEMEDIASRRMMMRIHNVVTIFVYAAMVMLVIATLLPMFIGR